MSRCCALVLLFFLSLNVGAQTLRMRAQRPADHPIAETSAWAGSVRYSVLSDYADSRMPRGYTHAFTGALGYAISSDWSVNASLLGRAELIGGQIDKGEEQSYGESVGLGGELSLDYGHEFSHHKISFGASASPALDQPSRLEGQSGILGVYGELKLRFFEKFYTITQSLEANSILNRVKYSSLGSANPDYFYSYKLDNSVRVYESYKLSLIFGVKTTRSLDGFWGYSYSNGIRASKAWKNLSAALSYENGGFTDDGEVRLWYVDKYRRIGKLTMMYEF